MKRFLIVLSALCVLGFAGCSAKGSNPQSDPPVAKTPDVWIAAPSPIRNAESVAYGAGNFVVVGSTDSATVASYYSNNAGVSWTQAVNFWGSNTDVAKGIRYGNNTFVVVPRYYTNEVRVSADGKVWRDGGSVGVSVDLDPPFYFIKDKFYAITDADSPNSFRTSSNGVSWTPSGDIGMGQDITSIAYGAEKYIAVKSDKIAASTNGTSWSLNDNTNNLEYIVYGSKFVAVSGALSTMGLYYSDDGETWLKSDSIFVPSYNKGIIYAAGYYVVYGYTGNAGEMAYSTDGITWTNIELPQDTVAIVDVAFGEDTFIAITGRTNSASPPSEILRCNMR